MLLCTVWGCLHVAETCSCEWILIGRYIIGRSVYSYLFEYHFSQLDKIFCQDHFSTRFTNCVVWNDRMTDKWKGLERKLPQCNSVSWNSLRLTLVLLSKYTLEAIYKSVCTHIFRFTAVLSLACIPVQSLSCSVIGCGYDCLFANFITAYFKNGTSQSSGPTFNCLFN